MNDNLIKGQMNNYKCYETHLSTDSMYNSKLFYN